MPRTLRETYPDAVAHVMARGNNGERIYADATDFGIFVEYLGDACDRAGSRVHAYCLMPNHYHLLLETPSGNLSETMRRVNGRYANWFNRRHGRTGYVFQSRYKSVLVEDDDHFLTVVRYIALNPVTGEAPVCESPEAWRWSSYPAVLGRAPKPAWLACERILGQLGGDLPTARDRLQNFLASAAEVG